MRGKRKFHCTEKAILRGERSEKERAKRVVNFLVEERLWVSGSLFEYLGF